MSVNAILLMRRNLFDYIAQEKKQPCEQLLYQGWRTDKNKDKQTPLMYWIYRCKGQAIPYDLCYHNYQTDRDKDGQTPLMIWIEYRRGEPIPKELFYDNYQLDKDRCGQTPLMLWIENR